MTVVVDQEIRWRPIAYPVVPEDKMVVRLLVARPEEDGVFLTPMFGALEGRRARVSADWKDFVTSDTPEPEEICRSAIVGWAHLDIPI